MILSVFTTFPGVLFAITGAILSVAMGYKIGGRLQKNRTRRIKAEENRKAVRTHLRTGASICLTCQHSERYFFGRPGRSHTLCAHREPGDFRPENGETDIVHRPEHKNPQGRCEHFRLNPAVLVDIQVVPAEPTRGEVA